MLRGIRGERSTSRDGSEGFGGTTFGFARPPFRRLDEPAAREFGWGVAGNAERRRGVPFMACCGGPIRVSNSAGVGRGRGGADGAKREP
jgi:hypothetical protein